MNEGARRGFNRFAMARARRSAVQAYYQWQITQQPIEDIINEFEADRTELKKADVDYFRRLLHGMVENEDRLNEELAPLLDRPVKELDPVERAVLHLGGYELLYCPETPWRVVINEAVELAKMFGAEQSHTYINGILDKLARRLRAPEITGAT
jgi:N utilization substance protein B